jgi:hypothetical protein
MEVLAYDVTSEITHFRTVTDSALMFQHLLQRSSNHFSQAAYTPFVYGLFGQHLHPFQQNSSAESILQGTIDLPVTQFDANNAILACISDICYPPVGKDWQSLLNNFNIFLS